MTVETMITGPVNATPNPTTTTSHLTHRDLMQKLIDIFTSYAQTEVLKAKSMDSVIREFLDTVAGETGYMRLQAGMTICFSLAGGVTGLAGALFPDPKILPQSALPIPEGFLEKLKDMRFTHQMLNTASTFLNQGKDISNVVIQSPLTHLSAKKSLIERVKISQEQQTQSAQSQAIRQAEEMAQRMIGMNRSRG